MTNDKKLDTGALFREENKKSDKSPDFTGTVTISRELAKAALESWNGEVRVAGWKNTSKTGTAYISLKLSEKRQPQQAHGGNAYANIGPAPVADDFNF